MRYDSEQWTAARAVITILAYQRIWIWALLCNRVVFVYHWSIIIYHHWYLWVHCLFNHIRHFYRFVFAISRCDLTKDLNSKVNADGTNESHRKTLDYMQNGIKKNAKCTMQKATDLISIHHWTLNTEYWIRVFDVHSFYLYLFAIFVSFFIPQYFSWFSFHRFHCTSVFHHSNWLSCRCSCAFNHFLCSTIAFGSNDRIEKEK